MTQKALVDFVQQAAAGFGIPGAAVGVLADGRETYGCVGVTSLDNPLPVDPDTLFLLGSVSKTYTATALMRLVAEGRVELDAPVRRYLPELRLACERCAAEVKVLNLLNHTSGLGFGLILDTGEGDDALATYVSRLAEVEMIAAPGERTSYSQAGFNLAGRIIETVTGRSFERAVGELLLQPLGLAHSFYARDDIMTRRFAVGHNREADGAMAIARLWRRARGDNPGGGLASSAADQLRWARFHLGEPGPQDGVPPIPAEVLRRMQTPTAPLIGSNLGDAIGIGWFLREIDGVHTFGHGGSANGQFADLLIVPERRFAVVALSNAGPDGIPFNKAAIRWALETWLKISDRDPEPAPFDDAGSAELIGLYANEVMELTVGKDAEGLTLEVRIKPAIRAAADKPPPPDHPACHFGLLPGGRDEYVITDGAFQGQRGFFTRDASRRITGVDLAGRLFRRIAADGGRAAT